MKGRTLSLKYYSSAWYGGNSSSVDYYYDNLSRIGYFTETHSGRTFTTNYSYNSYGQVDELTYPNSFSVKYTYSNGQLQYVRRGDNDDLIWQGVTQHPNGGYTESSLGNGLTSEISYNNFNFVTGITVSGTGTDIMDMSYTWDVQYGQLTGRSDLVNSLSESFEYDNVGRLENVIDDPETILTMEYSNSGDIISKSDAGDYTYSSTRPGAVEELDPVEEAQALLSDNQDIEYTDYDKVSEIHYRNPAKASKAERPGIGKAFYRHWRKTAHKRSHAGTAR